MSTLERLFRLIDEKFASDAEFERQAGLSPRTVAEWRRGKSHTYMKRITELAALLDTTSSYLLCETDKSITLDDFTYSMHDEARELTDAEKEMLLDMARVMKAKRKGQQDGQTD